MASRPVEACATSSMSGSSVDQRRDALAQKRMVVGGEDSDRLGFSVHEPAFFLRRNEKRPPLEAP